MNPGQIAFARTPNGPSSTATDRVSTYLRVGYFKEEGLVSDSAPIVGAQENAGDPHYIPSGDLFRPIRPNEVLLLDLWGKHTTPGAVYADITWCGFTGETPTPEIAAVPP